MSDRVICDCCRQPCSQFFAQQLGVYIICNWCIKDLFAIIRRAQGRTEAEG
jgi:uncharacterized protein CbrC (UPF0167 family)